MQRGVLRLGEGLTSAFDALYAHRPSGEDARDSDRLAPTACIETVYREVALGLNISSAANLLLGREISRGKCCALKLLDNRAVRTVAREELDRLYIPVPNVGHECVDLSDGQRRADLSGSGDGVGARFIPSVPTACQCSWPVTTSRRCTKYRTEVGPVPGAGPMQGHSTRDCTVQDIVRWITGAVLTG